MQKSIKLLDIVNLSYRSLALRHWKLNYFDRFHHIFWIQKRRSFRLRHFAGGGNFCDHFWSKKIKTSPSPSDIKDNLFIDFVKQKMPKTIMFFMLAILCYLK